MNTVCASSSFDAQQVVQSVGMARRGVALGSAQLLEKHAVAVACIDDVTFCNAGRFADFAVIGRLIAVAIALLKECARLQIAVIEVKYNFLAVENVRHVVGRKIARLQQLRARALHEQGLPLRYSVID